MNGSVALRISILLSLIVLATNLFIHSDRYNFPKGSSSQSFLLNLFILMMTLSSPGQIDTT